MSATFDFLFALLLSWKFWLALAALWLLLKVRQQQIMASREEYQKMLAARDSVSTGTANNKGSNKAGDNTDEDQ